MTSDSYAADIRDMILDNSTSQDGAHYGGYDIGIEDQGTSHFSVIAENGDAVAATGTINYA